MSRPPPQHAAAPHRRRYLIHLFCVADETGDRCRYALDIWPWTARGATRAQARVRIFSDVFELIATINPLLPAGSDVRDVLAHIESREGFFYLLHLTSEQANQLDCLPD
jgi:hypothetical protein